MSAACTIPYAPTSHRAPTEPLNDISQVGEKGPAKKGPAKKAADGKKKKKISKAETYKIYIYSAWRLL